MKINIRIKSLLPYLVAIAVFIVLTLVYCKPMLDGKKLYQSDTKQWEGMAHEAQQYKNDTGNSPFWTNSMFSGMPTYQITSAKPSGQLLNPLHKITDLNFGEIRENLILYFLGFLILMLAFGMNKWVAIVGSIAITFSSYFFIIIPAGHMTKAATLGLMAPVISGFYLIFRKKYAWGVALTMIYSSLGLMRHPQMSYYLFMMMGIFGIAEVVIHIKEKRIKDLIIGVLVFGASIGIGVGTGYSTLKSNQEYVKETMRGGHSELTPVAEGEKASTGLSLEYATQWSYGIDETLTLLIPNYMGGSSNYPVGTNSKIYEALIKNDVPAGNAKQWVENLPMYWGDQPFTSGSVYVGALVCFLFVLGIFVVKGPYKWALVAATCFSIILSWGHNLMGVTKFFFEYFPFYDKFRTVSSILVVAEIAMPLLGFLALKALMDGSVPKEKARKSVLNSALITGGLCLFIALIGPMLYNFTGPSDSTFAQLPEWFYTSVLAERSHMMRSDAIRSLCFIIAGAGVIALYLKDKLKLPYFVLALGLIVLVDMWPVNKRFFNNSNFVSKSEDNSFFTKLPYEEQILEDPELYFRVMNLTTNTFNDARTSYYLKSIGGYHAAKLRRYQDLIDAHLSKGNINVLNMLNTKYVIDQDSDGQYVVQVNPQRYGNGWFVDHVLPVESPIAESDALNSTDLRTTAVTDKSFSAFIQPDSPADSTASITLTSYAPDVLEYKTTAAYDKTAVFSEIYYPYGWKATIDGQPAEHFRVDYVLRALNIPAGAHTVRFEFRPDSIYKGDKVSIAFIILMYLVCAGCIGWGLYSAVRSSKQPGDQLT